MNPGRLDLELDWDGETVTGVAVHNSRPSASAILTGRSTAEVGITVPLLYSVCRHGQSAGARLALAAAQGREVEPAGLPVAAEAMQEHLWRLLLDWPRLLGQEEAVAELGAWFPRLGLAAARGAGGELGPDLLAYCESRLLGMPAEAWLSTLERGHFGSGAAGRLLAALADGSDPAETLGFVPAGLRAMDYFDNLPVTFDQGYAREPTWQSAPAETGALAHWVEVAATGSDLSGIALRVWARIAEVAAGALEMAGRRPARSRAEGFSPAPGLGFATVDTARGLLMHAVQLESGTVADYIIVAPTEWNFHPEGPFVQGLRGYPANSAETLRRTAERLALSLDPCVPAAVTVRTMGGVAD